MYQDGFEHFLETFPTNFWYCAHQHSDLCLPIRKTLAPQRPKHFMFFTNFHNFSPTSPTVHQLRSISQALPVFTNYTNVHQLHQLFAHFTNFSFSTKFSPTSATLVCCSTIRVINVMPFIASSLARAIFTDIASKLFITFHRAQAPTFQNLSLLLCIFENHFTKNVSHNFANFAHTCFACSEVKHHLATSMFTLHYIYCAQTLRQLHLFVPYHPQWFWQFWINFLLPSHSAPKLRCLWPCHQFFSCPRWRCWVDPWSNHQRELMNHYCLADILWWWHYPAAKLRCKKTMARQSPGRIAKENLKMRTTPKVAAANSNTLFCAQSPSKGTCSTRLTNLDLQKCVFYDFIQDSWPP